MTQAIDRSEGAGLGISLLIHVVVLGALSVSFLAKQEEPPKAIPIDISLAEDVGMESAAPVVSHEELAAKKSPVEAPVEPDTAPPPSPEPQPQPQPKPEPARPKAEPKPKPEPRPEPKPAPAEKPKPAKPERAAAPAKPAPQKPTRAASTTGSNANARRPVRPTGNLDGLDLGRSNNKTNSTATNNPASAASPTEVAGFRSVIARQVQPCANRQVTPGPGAERIQVLFRVNFNPDGSLAGDLEFTGVRGKDAENARYVERVKDLAIASFRGCTPIRGLPAKLYDVPNGWKSLPFSYKLPG